MKIVIPELSLVTLIGASGSGKSTFARKHFKPTEVLSSDFCRGLVSDDENDQGASTDAFAVLHFIAAKRLAAGKLTVVDATNVEPESRKPLLALAREYHCLPVAIVFNLPEKLCHERNQSRPDRDFGPHVVRRQTMHLRRSLHQLQREGFQYVFVLSSLEEIEAVEIERQPLWNNLKREHGPFDIIGDVHGCFEELQELLKRLGYEIVQRKDAGPAFYVQHPQGRRVIFLGDLVDRGPASVSVLRKLKGKNVRLTHGLAETLQQLEQEPPAFKKKVETFLDKLVSHYVLDDGLLVVAHAGMKESLQGRASRQVREFALYGETTGETDEFGLPVRYNWAAEYRGKAMVIYGHTTVPEPEWLNRTINIDTGCAFGGKLTALRYPEKELVPVPAAHTYWEPARPFHAREDQAPALTAQQQLDDILDMEDVSGKRLITTSLHRNITIREENAIAALEVMSRFAANPKWLIYLPPTMSPSETTREPGLLEHPAEAFAYYRHEGVSRVVCEEKHMGSRAVIIICRDEDIVRKRFGMQGEGIGICYTRTGRRFFEDAALESEMLARVQAALEKAGFWTKFHSDWFCLDCELMPWSVKAQALLQQQYAAVGAASHAALAEAVAALAKTAARDPVAESLLARYHAREKMAAQYIEAIRHYCWPVHSVTDLKLAPFHILATQGETHVNKDHAWHMDTLAELCRADEQLLLATPYRIVDVTDPASIEEGVRWWQELTDRGGEGMVVKPFEFIARGRHGIVQPAVKCRGPEYLRIIYGPEYTIPEHLERLRVRGLGAKRSLALREFALGIEALERFVRSEPLRRVHECVFGMLALESEPVDPRL